MLVTERAGRMRIVTREGQVSPPLNGVPDVWASGQGGLLDVVVDKSFAQNRTVYFCFAERTEGGGRTAVARARLDDGKGGLGDVKVIFRQQGPLSSGNHYGCRIAQAEDGNLFVTLGDHFTYRDQAQSLDNHLGKVIRIAPDGSVPSGNPFAGRADARPEIWSYGHRNPQSLAIHPASGELWEIEHGPRGGDEVNLDRAGLNYGWPDVAYGVEYRGTAINGGLTEREGTEQPAYYWDPSIAPGGMTVYDGAMFPGWRGNLLVAILKDKHIARLVVEGGRIVGEERLMTDLGERVRDVAVAADGAVWVVTDETNGKLVRLAAAN